MDTATSIRIVGQPKPEEDAWLHRFRNFGEEVYVQLRDRWGVSIKEIDAATDTFHVREIRPEEAVTVTGILERLLREHHLEDSVVVMPCDAERTGFTVALVVDPAAGERLRGLAFQYDTWVVPSDANRAVVEEIRERRKERRDVRSLTLWSNPMPAVTEKEWLAMLDTIEVHHGAFSCEPPLDTLSVYGAPLTPAITVALREYEYDTVKPTALGFLAFKRAGLTHG